VWVLRAWRVELHVRGSIALAGIVLSLGCSAATSDRRPSPDAAPDMTTPTAPPDSAAPAPDRASAPADTAAPSPPDSAVPAPAIADAAPADVIAPGPRTGTILVYSNTTGNRHENIPTAVKALQKALGDAGYTVQASEDPTWFTREKLAPLAAIVLVSTTGKPIGDPGTEQLAALDAYVKGGGVLVGLHAASSTFYDPSQPWTPLIGGKFIDHPGGVRKGTCHAVGKHPAVDKLPVPFVTTDEIYSMSNVRPDNQVILTCDTFTGGMQAPIAWWRNEGQGRVFYTALGHLTEDYAADAVYFRDHALPGILWALGR
jgi:type 1 glutamine amidotransferase